jgi:glycosyltransferase A (GT-A) superfamily protein (DUF2064 family)
MSTPHVLTDTLTLAANTGVTVSLLPPWYDVDTLADLDQLRSEVAEATDGIAAFTRRWLSQALRREGAA